MRVSRKGWSPSDLSVILRNDGGGGGRQGARGDAGGRAGGGASEGAGAAGAGGRGDGGVGRRACPDHAVQAAGRWQ